MKIDRRKIAIMTGFVFLALFLALLVAFGGKSCKNSKEKTPTGSPEPIITQTPEITQALQTGMGVELDFSKNLSFFKESNYTISGQGSYKILHEAKYYNADGEYAGSLCEGAYVYANACNSYYKNLLLYRKTEGGLEAFTPECGKYVYQVVIKGKNYYMKPGDLYGSYMGTEIEKSAEEDETEAFCIAEGLGEYYHGEIWYYDREGKQECEQVFDVTIDGVNYFLTLYNNTKLVENYMTRSVPWGKIWSRFQQDPAAFSERDEKTGYTYEWKEDTFCFMDLDMDGICEYELKVEEWFAWKELE